jgi:hypothetical protein
MSQYATKPPQSSTTARAPQQHPAYVPTRTGDRIEMGHTSTCGVESDEEREAGHLQAQRALRVFDIVLESIETGVRNAETRLWVPEAPVAQGWPLYLNIAVSALLAGIAGGVAALVTEPIVSRAANRAMGDALKETILKNLRPGAVNTVLDSWDIKAAFVVTCQQALKMPKVRAARDFDSIYMRLRCDTPAKVAGDLDLDLDVLSGRSIEELAERQALIAWTNFLARAIHGAPAGWKDANDGGSRDAIPTKQAAPDPTKHPGAPDPTTGNVSLRGIGDLLVEGQRPMMDDHYGLLEVHLWSDGALNTERDYGIRLDNVGPKVRERIRGMGRVRDVGINKIVRVASTSSEQVRPAREDSWLVITADGYIRSQYWNLRSVSVAAIAEVAQNLSLTHLG